MDGKKSTTLTPYYEDKFVRLYVGDVREIVPRLAPEICQSAITSPPYFGLRDYSTATWKGGDVECGHVERFQPQRNHNGPDFGDGRGGEAAKETTKLQYRDSCKKCGAIRIDSQIGLEASPDEFKRTMVAVFDDVRRVLKKDGTLWLNLGDSFSNDTKWGGSTGGKHVTGIHGNTGIGRGKKNTGMKPKDLMLIPHTVAMALRDAGWWLRQAFPWVKRSAMPESVDSRAANAVEYVFHLQKSSDCFYDADAVRKGMAASSIQRLSQDTAALSGSVRANGGEKSNGTMKAVGHLRDRSLPTNRNGEHGNLDETPAGSRNFRNADLWFESTETPHGLTFVGDQIVGVDCNPAGFSAEYCTACGRYYHDSKDKKEIVREKIGDKTISHCICGRTDAWLSHFATFPKKFVEPFIKCSTSEVGECSTCGKAWVRVTEITRSPRREVISEYAEKASTSSQGNLTTQRWDEPDQVKTIGWQPQCECNVPTQPQTVFEPFSGAGTTFIVAAKLGRRCIAIELNEHYAAMSVERYKREMKMAVDPPRRVEAMPLFAL